MIAVGIDRRLGWEVCRYSPSLIENAHTLSLRQPFHYSRTGSITAWIECGPDAVLVVIVQPSSHPIPWPGGGWNWYWVSIDRDGKSRATIVRQVGVINPHLKLGCAGRYHIASRRSSDGYGFDDGAIVVRECSDQSPKAERGFFRQRNVCRQVRFRRNGPEY